MFHCFTFSKRCIQRITISIVNITQTQHNTQKLEEFISAIVQAKEYFKWDNRESGASRGGVNNVYRASEMPSWSSVSGRLDLTDWQTRLVLLSSSQNSPPYLLLSLPIPPTDLFLPSYLCSPPLVALAVCGKSHQRTSGADVQVSRGDQHTYPGETGPWREGGPAGRAQKQTKWVPWLRCKLIRLWFQEPWWRTDCTCRETWWMNSTSPPSSSFFSSCPLSF